jgi:hypothetical protein
MPFTIHEAAVKKQMFWQIARPQEPVQKEIPENWQSTPGQGLPVLEIPHWDFPRVVYLHPNTPTRTIIHRNDRHEVVDEELVPLEHLTKVIACDAHIKNGGPKECPDCNKGLQSALAEGWTTKPYLPEPPAKSDADLYGPRKKK